MSGNVSHDQDDDEVPVVKEHQEDNNEEQEEWIEKYDETYNLYYYLNTVSGECQWDSPFTNVANNTNNAPQTPGHQEYHDREEDIQSQDVYFHDQSDSYYIDVHHDADAHQSEHSHQPQPDYTQAWNDYYAQQEGQPIYYQQEDYAQQQHDDYPFDYDSDEAGDEYEHLDYEPYDEEAAPKSIKNRSKDLKVGGSNQDYVHMARMYKLTRPYSDPNYSGLCVLCHTNFADMVFFPCEHRCVCSECVQNEHICSDIQMESIRDGYCNCSLCAGIIKLILPSEGGAEVEKYWKWVYEEPVPLPTNFLRNFRHSAAVIKAVHVRNEDSKNIDSFENASKSCVVS